uniref:Uncharacterized protein n=1 Tax=Oryza sativa subsp. japonica TaxID=39947 RepID=Q6ZL98_ORYSJ|nr:hypothetical protein [Oryza sativa Japonica Group]
MVSTAPARPPWPAASPFPSPPPPSPSPLLCLKPVATSYLSSSLSPAAGCHHRPPPPNSFRFAPAAVLQPCGFGGAAARCQAAASHGHPSKAGELSPLPPPPPPHPTPTPGP